MATYSVNSSIKGAKFVLTSEKAASMGSSGLIPLVVCPLDRAKLQSTMASLACDANTDEMTVILKPTSAVKLNEWAGQYVAVLSGTTTESLLILKNSAAASGSALTITVDKQFSFIPTTSHTAEIRRWKELNYPVLYSSLATFANDFMSKNAVGETEWSGSVGSQATYHTLDELKKHGASLFYVLPVSGALDAATMQANLAPTGDSTFTTRLLEVSPQPDIVLCPKQDLGVTMSSANWSAIDTAWKTFITNYAEDSTVNPDLREMLYVTDCGDVASTAGVSAYKTTSGFTGNDAARVIFTSNRYYVPSLVKGARTVVASSPAFVGLMNKIATTAIESFGHAFCGQAFAQVSCLGVVENITPANLLTQVGVGVNPLVSNVNKGTYFYSQFTQKKASTSDGSDPLEHLHVIVTRLKVKNTVQPILDSITDEPNTDIVRAKVVSQVTQFLDTLKNQSIIEDFQFTDVTTDVDETSGIARFELSLMSARSIDFIELKLCSVFA